MIHLECIIAFYSILQGFCWEICYSLMSVPLYKRNFSLAAFKIISLYLIFDGFITMCLREDCFGLKFWSDLLASWTWMSKSLPRFGKFSTTISSNKLSTPLLQYSNGVWIFLLKVFHRSYFLFNSFSFSKTFYPSDGVILIICLQAHWFFCLVKSAVEALYWIFQVSHFTLQFPNFCLVVFCLFVFIFLFCFFFLSPC